MISIIIPIYNTGYNVIKLLDSILANNFYDIEVILINDGSTDNTLEIIKSYLKNHPIYQSKKIKDKTKNIQIKLFTTENQGVSSARNLGLEKSSGEYIVFIDSDDTIHKKYLKTMYQNLNDDIDLVVCGESIHLKYDIYYMLPDSKLSTVHKQNINVNYILKFLLNRSAFYPIHNKIYKKSIIEKTNLRFDKNLDFAEDLKFNLYYILNSNLKIKFINKPLYKYQHSSSTSIMKKSSILPENWDKSFDDLKIWVKKYNKKYKSSLFVKIKIPFTLFTIRLRWYYSHASNVFEYLKNHKERLKHLNIFQYLIFGIARKIKFIIINKKFRYK